MTAQLQDRTLQGSHERQDPAVRTLTEAYAQEHPQVSICIVNWNGMPLLEQCLRSIFEGPNDPTFEVLVADNGSTDDSVEMIKTKFLAVRLIVNDHNVGFAKANNQMIVQSLGEFILLLNNDAWLTPSALGTMVRFMQDRKDIGILGPKVLLPDGILQPTHSRVNTLKTLLFPDRRLQKQAWALIAGNDLATRRALMADFERDYGYLVAHEVDLVLGCCLLVRREMVENVGMMDEAFFMYYEEDDWCLRARRKGWKVYYLPEAVIYHNWKPRTAKANKERLELARCFSQLYYYRKHFGLFAFLLLVSLNIFRAFTSLLGWFVRYVAPGGDREAAKRELGLKAKLIGGSLSLCRGRRPSEI